MTITRRADYAVRMMYELAQLPSGIWLSIRDLCEAADIPNSFGQPLVQFLSGAGLVHTSGSREYLLALAIPASELTMAKIIKVAEPEFSLSPCTMDPSSCGRSQHCRVHAMWQDLDRLVWDRLESITLEDVVIGRIPLPNLAPANRSSALSEGFGAS